MKRDQNDDALLSQLLDPAVLVDAPPVAAGRTAAPVHPVAPSAGSIRPAAAPSYQAKHRRDDNDTIRQEALSLYEKIGATLAALSALAFAGLLWWIGAHMTLNYLDAEVVDLASLGGFAWSIPLAITAVEAFAMPRLRTLFSVKGLVFSLALSLDLFTTARGLAPALAGQRRFEMDIPVEGWGLWGVVVVIGLMLAFLPERIARWAVSEIMVTWSVPTARPATT